MTNQTEYFKNKKIQKRENFEVAFLNKLFLSGYVTWELIQKIQYFIISPLIAMVFQQSFFLTHTDRAAKEIFWRSRPKFKVVAFCF